MARVGYNLRDFNKEDVARGLLCVIVTSTFTGTEIYNINTDGSQNNDFIGVGICRSIHFDGFAIMINNTTYEFSNEGIGIEKTVSDGYVIKLGTVINTLSTAGNAVKSNSTTVTEVTSRGSAEGTSTSTYYNTPSTVVIDSLNARDEFAINALRELLKNVEKPEALSDNEMNYYCNAAYQWAANMMSASAAARGTYDDKTTSTTDTSEASVTTSELSSNTEKLLNNIVVALQRTDEKTINTTESGAQQIYYSERISIPDLLSFLNTYVKNGDSTVGLKDLIEAIKNIQTGGGGGSTTVDFTDLITAIKETRSIEGTINLGSSSLGNNKDHPFYISGGVFPSKQALSSGYTSTETNSVLSFNDSGAVGYTLIEELAKAVAGNSDALSTIYTSLKTQMEADMKSIADTQTRHILAYAYVTVDGTNYYLTVPNVQ